MRTEIVDTERVAAQGAAHIAAALRAVVEAQGRATVAFSGGSTAEQLLTALTECDVPWPAVDVLQVDERVAPDGDPERNLTVLRQRLLDHVPISADRIHSMPVGDPDLDTAAARYADLLYELAGRPPRVDLIHLGLGDDGHTASLVPGSPLLAPTSVAVTEEYRGRRRMTLTLSVLSEARHVLWYVTGAAKAPMVRRLVDGDTSIPAGKVERSRALLLLDPPAASALPPYER